MKLKLNKKKLKNLSQDKKSLPAEATPQVGGGIFSDSPCLITFDYKCYPESAHVLHCS
ncbi:hypothetical protein SG34_023725 [Thalassomonas viridans]|uniref:Uncharacterized protein n=1 Tax=Thalassomonas viridans TaxID=137584 RepID=A0AAF0C8F8_9GAMM|nr:hypothetical protein [Thalassomonas viridans]WDE04321.1 hypothetical protein SG34_023725 [Thalassomonas viridans]